MQSLTISKIVEITKGALINGNEDVEVLGFSKDTRTINANEMYVGIKGEKYDGNIFYKQAFEKGAIGAILDSKEIKKENLENYANIVLVEDSIKAIQDLARYKRSLYNMPVVAVTGSVGKTSTKDMISSVLEREYKVLKTEGNNNNHIGLPLTLLKLKEHTAVVVEMGMNHFGEISLLTNIAKPNICVITNIGTSHIGNLGSRENILKAKMEILEGMEADGVVIVNNDNDLLNKWAKDNYNQYNIKTYGIENTSDYMAYNLNIKESESTYSIKLDEKEENVNVTIPGVPFVYNSLCGIAVGKLLGIQSDEIIQGIRDIELTKKRMEIIKTASQITIINDAYNASLDSVKPALEQLKIIKGNRKIAVLGDMLELGEFTKELHEEVGEAVVENNIDILITVGECAKYIEKKAKELQMEKVYSFETNEGAIEKILQIQEKDDVILLKASNSMHFNEILDKIC